MKHLCPHHLTLAEGGGLYLVWSPLSAEVCRPALSEGSSCFVLAARLGAAGRPGGCGICVVRAPSRSFLPGVPRPEGGDRCTHSWVSVKAGPKVLKVSCLAAASTDHGTQLLLLSSLLLAREAGGFGCLRGKTNTLPQISPHSLEWVLPNPSKWGFHECTPAAP